MQNATPPSLPPASPADPEPTQESAAPVNETIIEPDVGWQMIPFREIWAYRELLFFLAWRDIKVRYKQTALGAAWAILQPVLMMAIFTLFLGRIAKVPAGDLPYPLFVYAGLLPWFFFATAIQSAGNSLIDSERLITKVYFPRLVVPFGAAGAAIMDFTIAFLFLLGLMAVYGYPPGLRVLLVPLALSLILLTALGVGTLLAALNVAYRDFRYVLPFLIQAWLFATPSIYMTTSAQEGEIPPQIRWLLDANPMTGLIAFFRAAVLDRPLPWTDLGISAVVGVALFFLGCLYFKRMEDSFADTI